jgi:hypothetical protein
MGGTGGAGTGPGGDAGSGPGRYRFGTVVFLILALSALAAAIWSRS